MVVGFNLKTDENQRKVAGNPELNAYAIGECDFAIPRAVQNFAHHVRS